MSPTDPSPSPFNAPSNPPETPGVVQTPTPPFTEPTPSTPPVVPISPKPTTPPGPALSPSAVLQTPAGGKGGGFKIFVIIAVVIIAVIYAAVGYLYFQNQKMKNQPSSNESTPSVTPTPAFTPDQVKIKNGSVIRAIPGGEETVLVDKGNYDSTGITGFAKVSVSPDNSKLCFESWAPAPEPALYVANVDGTEVAEVSPNRSSCFWAPSSGKIFYTNTAPRTSAVQIYVYDLTSKTETSVTAASVPTGVVRRYQIVGLSADSTKLMCNYEDSTSRATPTPATGQCEVDLESNEVTLL